VYSFFFQSEGYSVFVVEVVEVEKVVEVELAVPLSPVIEVSAVSPALESDSEVPLSLAGGTVVVSSVAGASVAGDASADSVDRVGATQV